MKTAKLIILALSLLGGLAAAPTPPTSPDVTFAKNVGDKFTLTANVATGSPAFTFQFQKNGVAFGSPITGTSPQTITVSASVLPSDAGSYNCLISNPAGATLTNALVLTVNPVPPAGATLTGS